MATLQKWTPGVGATPFDGPGNYGGEEPDGFTVASHGRDSCILEESNFDCIRRDLTALAKRLKCESKLSIHRCSHWGCGWIETLIIATDAPRKLKDKAEEIAAALAGYPIYDERDFCDREHVATRDYWNGAPPRERMRLAKRVNETNPLRFARMRFSTLSEKESLYDYVREVATE